MTLLNASKRRVTLLSERYLIVFLLFTASLLLTFQVYLLRQPLAAQHAPQSPNAVQLSLSSLPSSSIAHAVVLFTPGMVKRKKLKDYVNLPPFPATPEIETAVQRAIDRSAEQQQQPTGLLHQSHPPGRDAVVGLAAYPDNMRSFVRFVGSLRHTGYNGHVILGVHQNITQEEIDYLMSMDVTMYLVKFVACGKNNSTAQGVCSEHLETLRLEWGRFEMSRQWLRACQKCTGWTLVADTRDVFFQTNPFVSLPDPSSTTHDLWFIEEIAFHSCPEPQAQNSSRWYNIKDNSRYHYYTAICYGMNHWAIYGNRPLLCSGTTIGTRAGVDRFLSVMADELHRSSENSNEHCSSPRLRDTDQWIMNYLYYQGRFGKPERTRTLPWGTGPVNTVGHACVNPYKNPSHSQFDIVRLDNATGLILNINEPVDSVHRLPSIIHQYDRCHAWIVNFMSQHPNLFSRERPPILSWKQ